MGVVQRHPRGTVRRDQVPPMKISTGCDVEQVERFSKLLEKEYVCRRIFTEPERAHISKSGHPAQTAAGIFCAKEAMSKALGCGLFGLLPQELGLEWDERGAPRPRLSGGAAERFGHLQLAISVSHTKETAFATCVALEE